MAEELKKAQDPFSHRRNSHKECRPLASEYLSRFFPDFLEIKATPNKGNVVVAGKEFLPGETLFQSTPFGAVVSSGYHTSVCQNCVTLISSIPNSKAVSCDRCDEIWYCTEVCRRQVSYFLSVDVLCSHTQFKARTPRVMAMDQRVQSVGFGNYYIVARN